MTRLCLIRTTNKEINLREVGTKKGDVRALTMGEAVAVEIETDRKSVIVDAVATEVKMTKRKRIQSQKSLK